MSILTPNSSFSVIQYILAFFTKITMNIHQIPYIIPHIFYAKYNILYTILLTRIQLISYTFHTYLRYVFYLVYLLNSVVFSVISFPSFFVDCPIPSFFERCIYVKNQEKYA